MKFGYDSDGKLVPIEQIQVSEAIAALDAKLNGLAPEARPAAIDRLRKLLAASGETFTTDDEAVFELYAEGLLELTNVEEYFGERLQRALLRGFGGADGAA